jgi:hypothetical protein
MTVKSFSAQVVVRGKLIKLIDERYSNNNSWLPIVFWVVITNTKEQNPFNIKNNGMWVKTESNGNAFCGAKKTEHRQPGQRYQNTI